MSSFSEDFYNVNIYHFNDLTFIKFWHLWHFVKKKIHDHFMGSICSDNKGLTLQQSRDNSPPTLTALKITCVNESVTCLLSVNHKRIHTSMWPLGLFKWYRFHLWWYICNQPGNNIRNYASSMFPRI